MSSSPKVMTRLGPAVICLAVGLCLIAISPVLAASATYKGFPTVSLYVDGRRLESSVPAIVVDGRTFVPLRAASEALGQKVWWDGNLGAVCVGEAPAIADDSATSEMVQLVQKVAPGAWSGVESTLGEAGDIPFVWVFGDRQAWYRHLTAEGVPEDRAAKLTKYAAGSALDCAHVLAEKDFGLDVTVAHEFVHVLFRRAGLAGTMPRWLNEGIAEYVAREAMGYGPDSVRGSWLWEASREDVLSLALSGILDELPGSDEDWEARCGLYPLHDQALLAVNWLVARSGRSSIEGYLTALRDGKGHEEAFAGVFGVEPGTFWQVFREAMQAEAQEATKRTGVQVELEVPEGFSGYLAVFPPGSTDSRAWKLGEPCTVTITLDRNGQVSVDLPEKESARYELKSGPKGLAVYVEIDRVPATGQDTRPRLKTLAISVANGRFGWYWSGNTAFWADGSRGVNTENPAYPIGITLKAIRPMLQIHPEDR